MVEGNAVIKNEAGIHCRPTAVIMKAAREYPGRITVSGAHGVSTLQSALELMMLSLEQGARVTIQVEGPEEETVLRRFVQLFETEFDFPDAHAVSE
jgi:phosphotransferase system HPr (HPr) family protein